jgi:D-lactate dehydrogenase
MKTIVYSTHPFEKSFLENAVHPTIDLTFTDLVLNLTSVKLSNGFEAVVLFTADLATTEVIEQLHKNGIKYIALRSAGYDHVDLKKTTELGIKVANVPNYSPFSIAEHSVLLLLSLVRKLTKGQALMKKNDFRLDELIGFDLNGKTIGIIGTGAIGSAFARIIHGFGCRLIACDPMENKALVEQTKIQYTTFENVCKTADVISLHCPLNAETKYLFKQTAFEKMKKGMILLNTARGGIINTKDLLTALNDGTIAGAGLDVYEHEKGMFFENHENSMISDPLFETLRTHPNVIITGHQAFLTKEALQGIAETTICNLVEWSNNRTAKNELKGS